MNYYDQFYNLDIILSIPHNFRNKIINFIKKNFMQG